MSRLNALPALLLTLSFKSRVALAAITTCSFLVIFLLLPMPVCNPAFLCVPVALSAWLFHTRGVLLNMAAILLAQWTIYSLDARDSFLALPTISSLLIELLAFVCIALLIENLRSLLERANLERQRMTMAYEKLQEAQRAKDQYIANTTHELRTSLTSVSGYLDLLDEHDGVLDKETRSLFLRYAKEGSSELVQSVNTILETMRSNAEKRAIKIEPVAVREVVREALDHLAPQLVQSHPIHIEIDNQAMVYADRQYLHQVIRNLLSNAFKYSPSRSPITVRASEVAIQGASHASGQICICIQDRGPGIPPSEQTRIFQQFVRLERDIAGPVSGSGIGLYTSKQLVEEMGGRIWVESTGVQGEGSNFCFVLPRASTLAPEKSDIMFPSFSLYQRTSI